MAPLQRIISMVILTCIATSTTSALFSCPKRNFPCSCIMEYDGGSRIHCPTNSSTNSAFDLTIYPGSWVRIQCKNSPKWSDFLLGSNIDVGAVQKVTITSCSSLGDFDKEKISKQLGITSVEEVQFEKVKGTLNAVDASVFADTKRLTLLNNDLGRLGADFIRDLPNLINLNLHNAHIQLPVGLFDKASSLKAVELSSNNLKVLKPGTFDGLKNIELLLLWKNEFTEFHSKTFRNLTSLITLSFNSNALETLPAEIFTDLVNLQVINLGANNFTFLPGNLFKKNLRLKIVKFSFNKVSITTLPERFFGDLPELREVSITRIGLLRVPENLFWGSHKLHELNMNRNYLTTLPVNFFKDAFDLHTLNMNFNDFKELPDELFSNTRKLMKLDLSKNHLTSINEKMFANLELLKELNLEENDLTKIHVNAFNSLKELKIAKFAHNKLTLQTEMFDMFGQVSPFHSCQSLVELHLSHNNVVEMFSDWIITTQLHKLDLAYNKFVYLQSEDLQFTSNAIHVDLSHNLINVVDLERLEFISSNQTSVGEIIVDLSANPIHCGCRVYSLLRYLNSNMQRHALRYVQLELNEMKCNTPDDMRNVLLRELKSNEFKCLIENEEPTPGGSCSVCDCWLKPADSTLILDCAYKNLTVAPERIDAVGAEFIEINLSGNKLEYAPNMDGIGFDKVVSLNVTNNTIGYINDSLITKNLQILSLDGNNLTSLDVKALEKLSNVSKLTLGNNPWRCDCSFLSFVKLNSFNIPDRAGITCSDVSFSDIDLTDFCPFSNKFIVILCLVLSFFVILSFAFCTIYHRFQLDIKVWLHSNNLCLSLMTEDKIIDSDKIYDAFVCFSHKDEDFVVKEIVNPLEDGLKPYKVCIHTRDWPASEWNTNQISRSIEESKQTIIIMSPNFIENVWGMMEFRTAHRQALEERRRRVIIILYGDVGPIDNLEPELRAYLQMNTYIEWGDPSFWEKLKYTMPQQINTSVQHVNNSSCYGNKAIAITEVMQEVEFVFVDEKNNINVNKSHNGVIDNVGSIERSCNEKSSNGET